MAMEQRFLLEAEGVRFHGKRVDLKTFEYRFPTVARKRAKKAVKTKSSRRKS
jgi:hypothetical protein